MSSITLPAEDDKWTSGEQTFDTSDISLPYSLGGWSDSVGAAMLDGTQRIVREYNHLARNMWRNLEKLAGVKAEVPKYDSCRQQILNIMAIVER